MTVRNLKAILIFCFSVISFPHQGKVRAQLQEKILNRFRTLVYAHLKTSTAEFFESRDIIGPHISD